MKGCPVENEDIARARKAVYSCSVDRWKVDWEYLPRWSRLRTLIDPAVALYGTLRELGLVYSHSGTWESVPQDQKSGTVNVSVKTGQPHL